MNEYIIEGIIIYLIAWVFIKYPEGTTIIWNYFSDEEHKHYVGYMVKCVFIFLLIMGTFFILKGVFPSSFVFFNCENNCHTIMLCLLDYEYQYLHGMIVGMMDVF